MVNGNAFLLERSGGRGEIPALGRRALGDSTVSSPAATVAPSEVEGDWRCDHIDGVC